MLAGILIWQSTMGNECDVDILQRAIAGIQHAGVLVEMVYVKHMNMGRSTSRGKVVCGLP